MFFLCVLCSACSERQKVENYNSPDVKLGVEPGVRMEDMLDRYFPLAKKVYVVSLPDTIENLVSNRIDAAVVGDVFVKCAKAKGENRIRIEGQQFGEATKVVVGIPRNSKFPKGKETVDAFLRQLEADGTLADMKKRWVDDGNYQMPTIELPKKPKEYIRVATTGLLEPFTFIVEGKPSGLDIELAYRFAQYLGVGIEFSIYDWSGIYSAAESGRDDFLFSTVYDSRESMSLAVSIPYYEINNVILVKEDYTHVSFLDRLKNNFITEGRWKNIAKGFVATITITVLATIIGSVGGFILCLLKLWGPKFVAVTIDAIEKVITGLPVLIILLYLFYVFLTNTSGLVVAILTFSITFSVSASGIFLNAIRAIDKSQWESAYSLGFTKQQTFWGIIMPQAARFILPPFCQAIVAMMLLTAFCGYVSIVDLTYGAQIIRARTYDSFIPLTTIALIYLILSWGLTGLLHLLTKRYVNRNARPFSMVETEKLESLFSMNNGHEIMVGLSHLKKTYEKTEPISNLTCEIKAGEVVSIIGPSGTGKTTLLRLINGLEKPTSGAIQLVGRTGMVAQSYNLFSHLTVAENIMYAPMKIYQVDKQLAFNIAMMLLRAMGLSDKYASYPDELSGGQKQRVAIARTIAMRPDIILFDEPTSALDPSMVTEIGTIIGLLQKMGFTMIIVTHDMALARNVSTRVLFLSEGGIYEEGSPRDIFDHPQRPLTREFVRARVPFVIQIRSREFDVSEMIERITNKASYDQIPQELIQKATDMFEIVVLKVLMPELKDPIEIEISMEIFSESIVFTILYNGEPFNPKDRKDRFGKLKGYRQLMEYEHVAIGEYTNKLQLTIRV